MKGVAFNLLEQIVARDHGEDTWDALLDASRLDGVYTSLGSYPDEDFLALVTAASDTLAIPADDVVCWFGRAGGRSASSPRAGRGRARRPRV